MERMFFISRALKKELLKLYIYYSIYIPFLIMTNFYPHTLKAGPVSNKEIIISIEEEFSEVLNKIINLYGINQGGRAKKILHNHSEYNIKIFETSPVDIIISEDKKFIKKLESLGLIKRDKILNVTKQELIPSNAINNYFFIIMENAPNPYEASTFFSFIKDK